MNTPSSQNHFAEFFRLAEEQRRIREENQQRQQELLRKQRQEEQKRRELLQLRLYQNPRLFLQTEGLYVRDPHGSISSQELYTIYQDWCIKEDLPLFSEREFWQEIKHLAPYYQMRYSGQVLNSQGKRVRGFRGIRPLPKEDTENT